jgi:dihydrofolate reductase
MGRLILSINTSLDGFVDHELFAATADDELHDFFSGLLDITAIEVFGRITYQLMEAYWPRAHEDPHATKSTLRFADKLNAIPKVVFSRTLLKTEWNNARLATADMVDEVASLRLRSGGNIALGGISIAQQFMRLGLIEEYWLVVHPIVAGNGKRLFPGMSEKTDLKLVDTRVFRSGVAVLHYLGGKRAIQ